MLLLVILAKAGIQWPYGTGKRGRYWIPACAGMTSRDPSAGIQPLNSCLWRGA
jgi:hypothetical protein